MLGKVHLYYTLIKFERTRLQIRRRNAHRLFLVVRFFRGTTRECAVDREATRGIAKSKDWGHAIDVGEVAAGEGAATGTGC